MSRVWSRTHVGLNKLQVQRLHVSQSSPLGISRSPKVDGQRDTSKTHDNTDLLPLFILNRVADPGIYYLLSRRLVFCQF